MASRRETLMNLTSSLNPAGSGLNLAELTSRVRRWSAQRNKAARLRVELESYSDRQLIDLGISRADIPAIAAGEWRRG